MKLGFFGNTNNYPFIIAMGAARLGHQVEFIVDQTDPLYRPDSRYPDELAFAGINLHDVSPLRFRHHAIANRRIKKVLEILKGCDAVMLNQYGPSLAERIDKPAIALLTGSDLYNFADPLRVSRLIQNSSTFRSKVEAMVHRRCLAAMAVRQRAGISRALAVNYAPVGLDAAGDRLLFEIGVPDTRRICLLIADTEKVLPRPIPMNRIPRILCVSRISWRKPYKPGMGPMDNKGTDVLLRGVACYIEEVGSPVSVHLVRKGLDVAETEQLIRELSLYRLVTWHEELTQAQLMDEIARSDIVLDQFGESFPSVGALEALAIGRPVIANWRYDVLPQYKVLAPFVGHATTPQEISHELQRFISDDALRSSAIRSRTVLEEHFSGTAAAKKCIDILERRCVTP